MYRPPPESVAFELYEEIRDFLIACGGHYQDRWGYADEDTHVLLSLVTGQFIYKKGCYFICWFMTDDEGIARLKDHIRPVDITNGERMWVLEYGIASGHSDVRRKLRKKAIKGAYWHRAGKGLRDFPRQTGGNHGKQ